MSIEQKSPFAFNVLGLDIGGTEIKAAVVNRKGDIIASHRASTPGTLSDFQEAVKTLARHLRLVDASIRGVGVGCKGIIDHHTTEVLALPGELNYLQGRRLSEILGPLVPAPCPVAADNDARVALIGEHQWGAARGRQNAIMLTLGTGVGGAILAEGKIMRGTGGIAGHLGHVTVDPNGALCICGNRGCLETVFSARAIEAEVFAAIHRGVKTQLLKTNSHSRTLTCNDIFDCARKGDEVARIVVERATFVLGSAIAGLVHILDPEIVILGGQISQAGDFLFNPIQREVDCRTRYLVCRKVPIVRSQIAEPSGVVGAAALAIEAAASASTTSPIGSSWRQ
jgi:glucokinase